MPDSAKSDSEKKKEDWMNSKWRPMMGWMYMAVCVCDFILFPVLWSILHAFLHSANITQWQPLTLQGAGLFHIAMGAVLGLAAWGRTQEKLGGANNGGLSTPMPTTSFGSPSPSPSSFGSAGGFGSPSPAPFASPARSFAPPATPVVSAAPTVSSTGKAMPAPAPEPEL